MNVPVRRPVRTRWRIGIVPEHRGRVIGARPTAAAAAAGTAGATACAHGQPYARPECSGVFFVEDIECRQADVGDFLLTETDFVTHSPVMR
jgi:hypothetical protein